jgi:hypothetical protein
MINGGEAPSLSLLINGGGNGQEIDSPDQRFIKKQDQRVTLTL